MQLRSQIIIVGGGLAGLSAAIYLGRAKRDTLLIDAGKSMARWEPKVENYLGFPAEISGRGLLERGRQQARRYRTRFKRDRIISARAQPGRFILRGQKASYSCQRLLLATGIFHIPPEIRGLNALLGHSVFFCKDCDGYRVQGKRVGIYGWTNEAAEYALALLAYTPRVALFTDGRKPQWDSQHAGWLQEFRIPLELSSISQLRRSGQKLKALILENGQEVAVDALFTMRGDVVFNELGKTLGAELDAEGQIVTDLSMRTSVKGLYAAGCVTPANCQMIIAAGQGATAAQAINKDLFHERLAGQAPASGRKLTQDSHNRYSSRSSHPRHPSRWSWKKEVFK